MVLEAREFLDAATLLETSGWLRQQFRGEETKFPLLAARAAALSDFKDTLAVIRRSVLPGGEISDDASAALRKIRASITQTRDAIQKTLKHILRSKNAEAGEDFDGVVVGGPLGDRLLAHVARDLYNGGDQRAVGLVLSAVRDELSVYLQVVEGEVL